MEPNYSVTPTRRSFSLTRKQLLLGGGLVAAVLIGIILLLGSGGKNISSQLQHLSLRLTNLQTMLSNTAVTRNFKNEELSSLVTEFNLNLSSDINELTPLMTEAGMPTKFDKSIVAAETDTSTDTKIEEATLNNQLDVGYSTVLKDKIASLRALLAETYELTSNTKLRSGLAATDKDLSDINKRLKKIQF